MLIKKILLFIIKILMIQITSDENDLEKYQKLKIEDTSSIKTTDLPSEFSKEAFEIVDEFIKKTKNIDFEILIYFDYIEGKILKCKLGSETNVKLKFDENEFKGKHVASIHNHTKDMYTPPSDKNFGIFSREWEDFELIAGINKLWILKSKLKDEKLTFELKTSSSILFRIALESASLKYQNQDEIDDECDELYGKLLSNYINDKNINNIQLKQREYTHDRKD